MHIRSPYTITVWRDTAVRWVDSPSGGGERTPPATSDPARPLPYLPAGTVRWTLSVVPTPTRADPRKEAHLTTLSDTVCRHSRIPAHPHRHPPTQRQRPPGLPPTCWPGRECPPLYRVPARVARRLSSYVEGHAWGERKQSGWAPLWQLVHQTTIRWEGALLAASSSVSAQHWLLFSMSALVPPAIGSPIDGASLGEPVRLRPQ